MTTEFKLPELGENIVKATIVGVLVGVGDTVAEGQGVLEVETDKAVIEVPSDVAGKVTEVHVREGQDIEIGQLLLTVEADAAEAKPAEKAKPDAPAKQPEAPTEPAAKVTVAPARALQPAAAEKAPEPAAAAEKAPEPAAPEATPPSQAELVAAAPAVRRFARELGVEINNVSGTGPYGRVTMDDVKAYVRTHGGGQAAQAAAQPAAPPGAEMTKWGPVEREKMSNVRRATARAMGQAWPTIPMVTQFDRADITELEQMRKQYGPRAEAAGGKLTPTAIILKVIGAALTRFPKFNASIDLENEEIIYKRYVHVGVAVDTDRGLLVPVIRDVDKKNVITLSAELNAIAQKARDRKLSLDDMQGGGFTISNLGGIGGTNFTPLVSGDEVAILGVARGSTEPVWMDGQFVPRLMMPLSVTYDHRLIDGADGARFLRWVCEALEKPFVLMLEG
ncbi:MAG: 2-oxo acid dehydrogenase subunit E2 [Caldilineales bacterium]